MEAHDKVMVALGQKEQTIGLAANNAVPFQVFAPGKFEHQSELKSRLQNAGVVTELGLES